jgi:hypothetical protein
MPLKRIKRAFKKVTKPIAKVLDKVVPNEIKPFLPYAAAVAPFMLPAGGLASLPFASNPAVQRALLSGTISLGSQLAQEGSEGDFDILPVALAAGSGYLSTPGATDQLLTTKQAIDPAMSASQQAKILGERSLLTQAKDFGITGLQKAGEFMSAPIREGGPGIFSMAGVKAASVPVTGQITQDAVNFAKQAEADYLAELAEFNRLAGEQQEASDADRRAAIIASMTRANFAQDIIDETLDQLGLKDGGVVKMKEGGIMDLGGKEMDMRTGGFIPIGAKERADDVPARLSKNEFVMTADAVRAAGGGSVNKGAKRMYDLMHKLEARA